MKKLFAALFTLLCIFILPTAYAQSLEASNGYFFETDSGNIYSRVLNLNGNTVKIGFEKPIITDTVKENNITLEQIDTLSAKLIKTIDGVTVSDISQNGMTLNFPSYLKPSAFYKVNIKAVFSCDGEEFKDICFYIIPNSLVFCDFEDYTSSAQKITGIAKSGYDQEYKPMWIDDRRLTFSPHIETSHSGSNRTLLVYDGSYNSSGAVVARNGVLTSDEAALGETGNGILEWSFKIKLLQSDGGTLNMRVSNGTSHAYLLKLVHSGSDVKIYTSNSVEALKETYSTNDWIALKFAFDQNAGTYSITVNETPYIANERLTWKGYYLYTQTSYEGEQNFSFPNATFDIQTGYKSKWAAGSPKYLIDDYKILYSENGKSVYSESEGTAVEFYDYEGKKLLANQQGISKIVIPFSSYKNALSFCENVSVLNEGGSEISFNKDINTKTNEVYLTPKSYEEGSYTLKCGSQSTAFILKDYPATYAIADNLAINGKIASAVVSNGLHKTQKLFLSVAAYKNQKLTDVKAKHIEIEPLCKEKKYEASFADFKSFDTIKLFALSEELVPKSLYAEGNFAEAKLGRNPSFVNSTVSFEDSYSPICASRNGKSGYVLIPQGKYNDLYFGISDSYMLAVSEGKNIEIEVEYFDEGTGCFTLFYDGLTHRNSSLGYINLENTLQWKTARFQISDAYFRNYFNGSDIKISLYSDEMNYSEYNVIIGRIKVKKLETKDKIKIGISSEKTGDIFSSDENVKFNILFDSTILEDVNPYDEKLNITVSYEIATQKGEVIYQADKTIRMNNSEIRSDIFETAPKKYGILYLTVKAQNAEHQILSQATKEFSYSINAENNKNTSLGVCAVSSPYLASKAGFGLADGGLQINYVYNKSDKTFALPQSHIDRLLEYERYGITYMNEIGAKGDKTFEFAADEHSPRSEEGLKLYSDYCEFISNSTKNIGSGVGTIFETWNEFDGATNPDLRPYSDYTNFLKYAYNAIKPSNPSAIIVGPTACGNGTHIIEPILKNGGGDYMDVCSIHPYDWTSSPKKGNILNNVAKTRALLDKYGYTTKPIWLSEIGWADEFCDVTTEEQGEYLVELYALLKAQGYAEKMFIYNFKDSGNVKGDREKSFGILHNDDRAKPAYVMLSAMNYFLADKKTAQSITPSPDFNAISFKDESESSVTMCWSDEGKKDILLTSEENIEAFDVFGNKISSNLQSLKIGTSPIYIIGNLTNITIK